MQKYTIFETELKQHTGRDPDDTDNWTLVYLADDVDARELQWLAIDRAQKAKIAALEKHIDDLKDMLREYGAHDAGCGAVLGGRCDCAWTEKSISLMCSSSHD